MNRIAAIQMTSGSQVSANLAEVARLIGQAVDAGATMVVLPENFAIMPMQEGDRLAMVEKDGAGPIQDFLCERAREHRIWLIGGTIPLQARQRNKVRAACLLFDDQGTRVARYDKIHLFDVKLPNGEEYLESGVIEAGDEIVVVDTPLGRLGLAVCYDLRFPELFRHILDEGAEIITLPSAFTVLTGKAHWEALLRARAIENLMFVIASAQVGRHSNGRETYGDSMIVGPWGEVLGRLTSGPGFVIADIDREHMQRVRSALPSIEHRKSSHVGKPAKGTRLSA
jgi:deaminated glutathione amidase